MRRLEGLVAVTALIAGMSILAVSAEETGADLAEAGTEVVAADGEMILEDEIPVESEGQELPEDLTSRVEIIPGQFPDIQAENDLIVDADIWDDNEIYMEEAENRAAGTGYAAFSTAAEITPGTAVTLTTEDDVWYKFTAPKTAKYQCDISFGLPSGATAGNARVEYYNSDGMYLQHAEIEYDSGTTKTCGVIELNSGETIYLSPCGYAGKDNGDGSWTDINGTFSFLMREADGSTTEEAYRTADEDYISVWCYNPDGDMTVCPNASLTLIAGWATYGNVQPAFSWESIPMKWGTDEYGDETWVIDESRPSTVLASTTNQVTVTAPSNPGEGIRVCFKATIGDSSSGIYSEDWFQITTASDAHQAEGWVTTKASTVLSEGEEVQICKLCGQTFHARPIPKLPAYITMNVAANSTIPLKVKQATTKIKVTGLQAGDYVRSWTSSKPKIATVNANGKITGKKKGTTVITVTTASGLSYSFKIKVQKSKVATKKIVTESPKKLTLKKKAKAKIGAQLLPITTLDKISYATSNKKVAGVSKGIIVAKNKGNATITVKAGKKTIRIRVKVTG